MRHVLVLAPADDLELHWQQPAGQLTESEVVRTPQRAAIHEALHEAIVRLSPWLQHHRSCARTSAAGPCDCQLQAAVAPYDWSI